MSISSAASRAPPRSSIEALLKEMEAFHAQIVNLLETQVDSEKTDANDIGIGRHIQNSNTESINELEPRSENELGAKPEGNRRPRQEPIKAFPLAMVLKACPEISMYGPGGKVSSWRELMAAGVIIRSMLGVSPSAYQDACDVMGPENAAVTIACILQRSGHINSAGGYLRDLTARARRDEFSLGPVLMALLRANGDSERKAG